MGLLPDTSHTEVCENPPQFFSPENCKCHGTKGLQKPIVTKKLVISDSSHTRLH